MASIEISFGELFKDALFKFLYHGRYAKEIAETSATQGYSNSKWGDDYVEEVTGIRQVTDNMIRIDFKTDHGREGHVMYREPLANLLNELVFRV